MIRLTLAALLALPALPAAANEFLPSMETYFREEIALWMSDPVIVEAIIAQNARTGALTQPEIAALDRRWAAEAKDGSGQLVYEAVSNPLAEFLRLNARASGGAITEVFVMDARGLNVAVSSATSDYWQGDEEKFTGTFGKGPESMHYAPVEVDESSGREQGQISATVTDPATGEPIGSITVAIDAETLFFLF